ncbi:hypothetical protein CCP4SC76_7010025 [Gammaproteobacteria bacterium]
MSWVVVGVVVAWGEDVGGRCLKSPSPSGRGVGVRVGEGENLLFSNPSPPAPLPKGEGRKRVRPPTVGCARLWGVARR